MNIQNFIESQLAIHSRAVMVGDNAIPFEAARDIAIAAANIAVKEATEALAMYADANRNREIDLATMVAAEWIGRHGDFRLRAKQRLVEEAILTVRMIVAAVNPEPGDGPADGNGDSVAVDCTQSDASGNP